MCSLKGRNTARSDVAFRSYYSVACDTVGIPLYKDVSKPAPIHHLEAADTSIQMDFSRAGCRLVVNRRHQLTQFREMHLRL